MRNVLAGRATASPLARAAAVRTASSHLATSLLKYREWELLYLGRHWDVWMGIYMGMNWGI